MTNFKIQYFTKYFQSMHYVAIVVLLVVALVENTARGFPINLIVAVLTASVLDIAIKMLWLKREPAVPLSAIITGLIIGTVSMSTPLLVFIATILAILSKFVMRLGGSHIFNPAVFGVTVPQLLSPVSHGATMQGASQAAQHFGPGGFMVSLWLAPLLVFASYKAKKLWTAVPFLIASAILYPLTGLAKLGSPNEVFSFLEILPWYFAFIIVSEPKTSPYPKSWQVVFGLGMAILSISPLFIFDSYSHAAALTALLLGNLLYAVWRVVANRYVRGEVMRNKREIVTSAIAIAVIVVAVFAGTQLDGFDLQQPHAPRSH